MVPMEANMAKKQDLVQMKANMAMKQDLEQCVQQLGGGQVMTFIDSCESLFCLHW